ncbi:MAG: CHAT domain-containing protein [Leptolyngbyaceae cyanobacterium]
MNVLPKAITACGLLSGVIVCQPYLALAQTITPADTATQATVSEQGIIEISGGTQNAGSLFHRFEQFDLSPQQTASFITTESTLAIISQILGGNASTIDGLLQVTGSNADLYLINPAGLIFGPNARLDLGGSFTATTATHLGNSSQWIDMLSASDYASLVTAPTHFGFSQPGRIVNQGHLAVSDGHSLRLLAPQVTNSGSLSAPAGEVTLFAPPLGHTITLGQTDGVLQLELTAGFLNMNNGPAALITGGNLHHSDTLEVSTDGTTALVNRADPLETPSWLSNLNNTGDISTWDGGEINLLGHTLDISGGTLDASGSSGGGSIRIGGDYQGQNGLPQAVHTVITDAVTLMADAPTTGDAGQIIVWAKDTTDFNGTISAQAAQGNGGLVETSAGHQLSIGHQARVNTGAPQGNNGFWLIDPAELTVVDAEGLASIETGTNDANNSTINSSTIVAALNNTNVTLQATEVITVDSAIDASRNETTSSLFLDTAVLNLNERIFLKDDSQLSGSANVVNIGINGSLQNGIDSVTNGGTLNLAATTYREGTTLNLGQPLTLLGQGRDNTSISGDINRDGIGEHSLFEITGNNITIADLTLRDGLNAVDHGGAIKTQGNNLLIQNTTFLNNRVTGLDQDGGAIDNRGSLTLIDTVFEGNFSNADAGAISNRDTGTLLIEESLFENNQALDNGGAIQVEEQATLTAINTVFRNNQTADDGGSIYNDQGKISLRDSQLSRNTASRGGAIFNSGSAELDTLSIEFNQASDVGGGFFNQIGANSRLTASNLLDNTAPGGGGLFNRGQLAIDRGVIAQNQATGLDLQNGGGGGGIYNFSGGFLAVEASLISNNTSADNGGGLLNFSSGELTEAAIANSTIAGNQAANRGGGIEVAGVNGFSNLSRLDITNSTVSGNQAAIGGGIRTVGPTTLTNVTVTANTATRSGGGISENLTTANTPTLINTIVAANRAATSPDVEGQFTDQGNNLIGISQGSTGFDNSSLIGTRTAPIDPKLTSLNTNAGILPSHQLLENSPAINAGDNTVATTTDQHGQPRIVDSIIDLGSVESNILPEIDPVPEVLPQPPQPPTLPSPEQVIPASEVLAALDQVTVLAQEELTAQSRRPDVEPTSFSLPSGRLKYFDEEAFQYLENTFSKNYENHWQLSQTQPVILQTVQQTLQQTYSTHQIRSAVVYAVFVPQQPEGTNPEDTFVLPRTDIPHASDDQLLLVFVPAVGSPVQHLVNVSRAELIQQAKLFRLAVSDPEDPLSYQALARQMYSWLLAPLQADLSASGIQHILYSLDQGLRTIPLAAMMKESSFVIEQYGISVIPSMGLTQFQPGNIPFEQRSLIAGAEKFQTHEALPAVPIELDIVAKSTQGTDVLLNETFTLDNFLALQASQQPDLLHLATHAEFNTGNLEQSFIQFWDAQLTFHQMRDLNWSEAELLILSACGTALSSPEAELGFTGLAAGAGIETVMGSLWNVSDIGTLALMTEFYTQLSQKALRFQSLRQAQIALIRGTTQVNNGLLNTSRQQIPLPSQWDLPGAEFSHPFYWAGFTMVGNPWY